MWSYNYYVCQGLLRLYKDYYKWLRTTKNSYGWCQTGNVALSWQSSVNMWPGLSIKWSYYEVFTHTIFIVPEHVFDSALVLDDVSLRALHLPLFLLVLPHVVLYTHNITSVGHFTLYSQGNIPIVSSPGATSASIHKGLTASSHKSARRRFVYFRKE